jgi:chorismate mutase/prephenate dehydrogenase
MQRDINENSSPPTANMTEKKPHSAHNASEDLPPNSATAELGPLRQRIDGIDEQIVNLLAERQNEVNKVVKLKKIFNLPIYHPAREENLISQRRAQGQAAGLDPDYLEELYRCIIRRSRVEQAARLAERGIRPEAIILIVGGKGSMGCYFQRWFSEAGYTVRILDHDDWGQVERLCRGVALVLLSVPIDATAEVACHISPHLSKGCILADITSLKRVPLQSMLNAHPGPVIGLHPLFGPSTSTMDKQIVVISPGRNIAECQWLVDQFSAWGAIIIQSTAEEHDEIMGIVQALRHFATFVFGQFLYRKQINLSRTLEFSSPIYRLELGMVGRLFAQDAALYAQIIFASPERLALLKDYVASFNDNLAMLEEGHKDKFCQEFEKISRWFGPFSEQAMRESTFLIDKLIERF